MSLNRYEQSLFDYWERQPDERRHWQMKTVEAAKRTGAPGDVVRGLERELWDYFRERTTQVPTLRSLAPEGGQRVSMLNLAEFMLRLWGPPPKPKRPSGQSRA